MYGRDGGRGVWRDGYVTGRFGRVRKGEEVWGVVVVVPFGGVLSICHSSCAPLVVCLVSGGSSGKSSLVSATFHRRGWVTSFPKAGRVCLCVCVCVPSSLDGATEASAHARAHLGSLVVERSAGVVQERV